MGVGTKSGLSGLSEYLQGPQNGYLGPKRAHFGPLGANKRPNTRPNGVATMIPTQSDRSAAVATKCGPRGPSESLRSPQKGHFSAKMGPFGVPGGPEEARYQAKVCGNHDSNPVGPISGNWDQVWPQIWPSELFSHLGPVLGQMGPFWPPVST